MNGKSPDAFRTISEVADWLDRPAHVLRFWESKFTQVKPVKRAGGRRYYRPEDMRLLGGIKKLLHDDGMTIKGAQKVLREQGVRYVSALSPPLDDEDLVVGMALDMSGAMVEARRPVAEVPDSAEVEAEAPVTLSPDPLPDLEVVAQEMEAPLEEDAVAMAPVVVDRPLPAPQTAILGLIAGLTAPVLAANRPAVEALLAQLDSLSARMAQPQKG